MRYIQVRDNAVVQSAIDTKLVRWGPDHNIPARRLTQEERDALGIFPLKLTTPPAFDPVTQTRTEIDPVLLDGEWVQQWAVTDLPTATREANHAAEIAALTKQIDDDTDALIFSVIGNRLGEYERAEREANAYKNAGYPVAPVPGGVKSWADAKEWTAQEACDDILAAATRWRQAQSVLRTQRLRAKQRALRATNTGQIDTVRATWAAALAGLRSALNEE